MGATSSPCYIQICYNETAHIGTALYFSYYIFKALPYLILCIHGNFAPFFGRLQILIFNISPGLISIMSFKSPCYSRLPRDSGF